MLQLQERLPGPDILVRLDPGECGGLLLTALVDWRENRGLFSW